MPVLLQAPKTYTKREIKSYFAEPKRGAIKHFGVLKDLGHYRTPTKDDIEKMSKQLTVSYVSAYKGLMSEEYLSSISANHWVPILEASIQKAQYISQGIGHSFYQEIEIEMKRIGCCFCLLEVLSTNKRAIRFYLSHGFVKTGTFTVEENGMILPCDKMTKTFE